MKYRFTIVTIVAGYPPFFHIHRCDDADADQQILAPRPVQQAPDKKIDTIVERYRINTNKVFQEQRHVRYHHCRYPLITDSIDQAMRTDGGGYEHQSDFRHGRFSAANFRSRQ